MSNISEFSKAIANRPSRKKRVISYRAYHEGTKLLFMHSGPVDGEWPEGNWIEITKKEYNETRPNWHIIADGKITAPEPVDTTWLRLEKADEGTYTSVKNNIIFVSDKGDNYRVKNYD